MHSAGISLRPSESGTAEFSPAASHRECFVGGTFAEEDGSRGGRLTRFGRAGRWHGSCCYERHGELEEASRQWSFRDAAPGSDVSGGRGRGHHPSRPARAAAGDSRGTSSSTPWLCLGRRSPRLPAPTLRLDPGALRPGTSGPRICARPLGPPRRPLRLVRGRLAPASVGQGAARTTYIEPVCCVA